MRKRRFMKPAWIKSAQTIPKLHHECLHTEQKAGWWKAGPTSIGDTRGYERVRNVGTDPLIEYCLSVQPTMFELCSAGTDFKLVVSHINNAFP
jgi:hypothetical protein